MLRKSERTHEENQERAYIAASRRTDRSLEARMESARRASEIHKRRTGKALKISEQDVINEEMYEEEDDDLPSAYRNLNSHLYTGSSSFDARLQAYLANAVAFRKALSGTGKPGDKMQAGQSTGAGVADLANAKQFVDHQSLFPKYSDNWKDVLSKKAASPKVVTNSNTAEVQTSQPYNVNNSNLFTRRRRLSSTAAIDNMGTLKPQDLQRMAAKFTPAARHPSLPKPVDDPGQLPPTPTSDKSPASDLLVGDDLDGKVFSSVLPRNTQQILLPWNADPSTKSALDDAEVAALLDDNLLGSGIDSTLAPAAGTDASSQPKQKVSPLSLQVGDNVDAMTSMDASALDFQLDPTDDIAQTKLNNAAFGSFNTGSELENSLWDFIDQDA
ncbi:hypothetical protein PYCC9005_003841 [Savitreella phatthalungensis]